MKVNYQILCDKKIEELTKKNSRPTLLLHSCCGPCSTYVLEYLERYFDITVFFYNPNIYPEDEFAKRLNTQREVIEKHRSLNAVKMINLPYEHSEFLGFVEGFESEPEGGARCLECFRLRMEKTAQIALEEGFDFFTTTLSVSPHKNAIALNELGREISEKYGVEYLYSDFKKREGYKRSIELSKEFGLYRQEYCGCEFSI